MPPGTRSLTNLITRYRSRSATEEPPPTRRLDTLKYWSQVFCWQARCAAHDAEMDYARKAEMRAQVKQQARENAKLMQQVGSGALAIVAVALNRIVDPQTGEVRQPVAAHDLPPLMKAGAELIQLATGGPTVVLGQGDSVQLEKVLRDCDDSTRQAILTGMRAALQWQERNAGVP